MVEALKKGLQPREFAPGKFGDPLARKISWDPAKGGGSNFRTHHLVEVGPQRVEVRATIGFALFCLVFVGMGVVAISLSVKQGALASALIGGVFPIAGSLLYFFSGKPTVFDRSSNTWWRGWQGPPEGAPPRRLSDIHALQIVGEWVASDDSSYRSYELNLVLEDGERVNVTDHGNLRRLREDAQMLSRFLGMPIWDAA